jgi:hypothetical protein
MTPERKRRKRRKRRPTREVKPEGLIKLQLLVSGPLTTDVIERMGGESAICAILAGADRRLAQVYQETGCIDLGLAEAELGLAAHRLPPMLATALQALLQNLLLPVVSPMEEAREETGYRLVQAFKDQGHSHDRSSELASEAAMGTPYGGVDAPTMRKSYTKGKRLSKQREQRKRELQRHLNIQSVEKNGV